MTGRKDETEGLANASVNTSTRGGSHDGQAGDRPPRNLGLPDDHQKGLDALAREKKPSQPHPSEDVPGNPERGKGGE